MLAYRFIELKKFGFNTFNGGSEYMYDIKDLREHPDMDSAFVKAFWGNLNSTRDDMLDIYEVKASYNIKETRRDIARMVCKHKIEWSYTKEEVSKEVTKFYDFLISNEDPGMKDALEGLVKQELDAIKVQVSKLMFWNEAAGLASPPPKEEKEESKVQISRGFRGHPELSIMRRDDKFSAEKGEAYTLADSSSSAPAPAALDVAPASGDTKEENPKPPGRIFPQNPNVYHFHPIAFVNQMKLMFPQSKADYCIQEMKVRAFLRLIKYKEGKPGEEGYRQIVGGGSFSDFKDHPRISKTLIIKGKSTPSDAAGAYQIMEDTWDTSPLNDKKKKYGIKDFSPLSQDYAALILLKYQKKDTKPSSKQVAKWGGIWADKMVKKWKGDGYPNATRDSFPKYKNRYKRATGDIIQMLIENDLDRALLTAAITWASFPDSIYGQAPSSYSIADAKIKFRELLLEEIKGETDLHLEKGFLKKFGYDCCNYQNSVITGISPEGKEPVDLRLTIPWHSQFTADTWGPYSHQSWMCYFTSKMILQKFVGLKAGGTRGFGNTTVENVELKSSTNVIQMALEENKSTINPIEANFQKGIDYLDQELEKGNPILVGVRHTYKEVEADKNKRKKGVKYEQNYDNTTDHYVIVVGRGYENNKRYFLFYEVGTSNSANGQHDQNRLYVNNDNTITGIPQHNLGRTYTLTQIRGNKTNGDFK